MQCSNNLKQMSLGTINMADTYSGKLPGSIGLYPSIVPPNVGATNNGDGGVFVHILPYIEQDNLYKSSLVGPNVDGRNNNLPTYSQWTAQIQNAKVKTYICPSDYTQTEGRTARSSYGQNGSVFREGYWARNTTKFPGSFTDGTSNTILYTEKLAQSCRYPDHKNQGCPTSFIDDYWDNYWPDWGPIINSPDHGSQGQSPPVADATGPLAPGPQVQPKVLSNGVAMARGSVASSPHTAGINVGLADGSVRFVSGSVSTSTWWFALTPNAGDILGSNW